MVSMPWRSCDAAAVIASSSRSPGMNVDTDRRTKAVFVALSRSHAFVDAARRSFRARLTGCRLTALPSPLQNMRTSVRSWRNVFVLSVVCTVASANGQTTADLHGTAHAGDRPAPDTVVWLDAPNAPPPASPPHALLDQRNLAFTPRVLVI